jgi:hypothetical protein
MVVCRKSSCELSCDTSWRKKWRMSSFVSNLGSTWVSFRGIWKIHGVQQRSWEEESSGTWSWVLKEVESSSIYARNDSKWMSGARAWACKKAAQREKHRARYARNLMNKSFFFWKRKPHELKTNAGCCPRTHTQSPIPCIPASPASFPPRQTPGLR